MAKKVSRRVLVQGLKNIGAHMRDDPNKNILRIEIGNADLGIKYGKSGYIPQNSVYGLAKKIAEVTTLSIDYLKKELTGHPPKKGLEQYVREHSFLFALIALVVVTFYFYQGSITGYTTLSTAKVVNPMVIIILVGIIALLISTKKLFKR